MALTELPKQVYNLQTSSRKSTSDTWSDNLAGNMSSDKNGDETAETCQYDNTKPVYTAKSTMSTGEMNAKFNLHLENAIKCLFNAFHTNTSPNGNPEIPNQVKTEIANCESEQNACCILLSTEEAHPAHDDPHQLEQKRTMLKISQCFIDSAKIYVKCFANEKLQIELADDLLDGVTYQLTVILSVTDIPDPVKKAVLRACCLAQRIFVCLSILTFAHGATTTFETREDLACRFSSRLSALHRLRDHVLSERYSENTRKIMHDQISSKHYALVLKSALKNFCSFFHLPFFKNEDEFFQFSSSTTSSITSSEQTSSSSNTESSSSPVFAIYPYIFLPSENSLKYLAEFSYNLLSLPIDRCEDDSPSPSSSPEKRRLFFEKIVSQHHIDDNRIDYSHFYREIFKLLPDRWFEEALIQVNNGENLLSPEALTLMAIIDLFSFKKKKFLTVSTPPPLNQQTYENSTDKVEITSSSSDSAASTKPQRRRRTSACSSLDRELASFSRKKKHLASDNTKIPDDTLGKSKTPVVEKKRPVPSWLQLPDPIAEAAREKAHAQLHKQQVYYEQAAANAAYYMKPSPSYPQYYNNTNNQSPTIPMYPNNANSPSSGVIPKTLQIKESEIQRLVPIGEGGAANVYKGSWLGTPVAVKVLKNSQKNMESHLLFAEVSILQSLRHPNVLLYMGIVNFSSHPALVTEYCAGGSAFDLFHKRRRRELAGGGSSAPRTDPGRGVSMPPLKIRLGLARDVALALTYMHSQSPPIAHRDLKSLNVLINQKWDENSPNSALTAKVADFGLSKLLDSQSSRDEGKTGPIGTCHWSSPEVLQATFCPPGCMSLPVEAVNWLAADVYSLGCLIYEFVALRVPFAEEKQFEKMLLYGSAAEQRQGLSILASDVILKGRRPSMDLFRVLGRNSKEVEALNSIHGILVACWKTNPGSRPGAQQVASALERIMYKL